MKCKFCTTEILAGYRCLDCYLKNITVNVLKDANPYKEEPSKQTIDAIAKNLKAHATEDLWYLGASCATPPFTGTFTESGNATNSASNSTTMVLDTSTFAKNGQISFQGKRKTTRPITTPNVCSR